MNYLENPWAMYWKLAQFWAEGQTRQLPESSPPSACVSGFKAGTLSQGESFLL